MALFLLILRPINEPIIFQSFIFIFSVGIDVS